MYDILDIFERIIVVVSNVTMSPHSSDTKLFVMRYIIAS